MKLLLSWLEQYIEDKPNWDNIFNKLTQAGIEVEGITNLAPHFNGVVVGEVIEKNKHPNADKLNICKVKVANNQILEIVCGASNVEVGIKVPCAMLGAILPNDFAILERKMRGVTSYGMLCSGDELGIKSDIDGLLILNKDAPIGMDIREYLKLDDKVVEFKITPNRSDCLSVKGILREISIVTNTKIKNIHDNSLLTVTNSYEHNDYINGRYLLKLANIDNNIMLPSFIIERISASGIESINPLIDLLNYAMLNLGQAFFAYANIGNNSNIKTQLSQNQVVKIGLASRELKLDTNTLINTIDDNIIAITGVDVTNQFLVQKDTNSVIIEASSILPDYIRGVTKKYNITSNTAYRYERGIDYNILLESISYVYNLLKTYMVDIEIEYLQGCDNKGNNQNSIELYYSNIIRIIGFELETKTIKNILFKIGCKICHDTSDALEVITPSYRFDLNLEIDLIEEIARVYGYDKVGEVAVDSYAVVKKLNPNFVKINNLKNKLVLSGYFECINYAFIEDKYSGINQDLYNIMPIRLQNAIAGLYNMRTSLIGGLIKNMQYNINRGHQSIKLFEVAKVFHGENPLQQIQKISGICYGSRNLTNWHHNKAKLDFDFYDIKADVMSLLATFSEITFESDENTELLHPGRCAKIYHQNNQIGIIGQLHPKYLQKLALDNLPYIFELDLDYILLQKSQIKIKPPLKFQKVNRDLAIVLDININGAKVIDFIYKLNMANLIYCNIFDVYTGSNVEIGKKSIAINLIFQANKTLVDDEINYDFNFIIDRVTQEFNAKLR
jgi:phenylalanyl-tRNA synthetase beta chain